MNTLGLSIIMKMGCICSKEVININGVRYVVKDHLGDGGFSSVHLVENASTKKLYALKRIKCHSVDDQKVAMQEINYCKKIKHPNIIGLIDSSFKGTADIVMNATSEAFLVLPYFSLGTLHDYLAVRSFTKNYLDIKDILRLFSEICQGVKYLHNFSPEPLAHRDLKTANVCLSEGMVPVIMDLGSCAPAKVQICGAQDAQKLQDLAAERCSMTYRAPELFHVESYCVIDQRTDIWSLGCVMYALCYFKSPFDVVHERGDSVNLAVISGTLPLPEEGPFKENVHDFIKFMMEVNPSERPYIDSVIEKLQVLRNEVDAIV
ncbi:serine/threonine-protein kinase 16 isoform X2 [Coccinella septempunctata]|uniref:serine/threonine-protein kinase 16 isoform X2 n=1 Tax=Coccinella septempunctata TaxID=41139 RepID=UPI001D0773DF|nr:serine/threonine-protein kinase 16 isoform X2 [Coccinella septempunctata]